MKESQGASFVDPAPLAVRSFPDTSRETPGHSLLLLQLRTELEGKWRPDKFGILRKFMNASSPKHWFCQKEYSDDYAVRPGLLIRNVNKRNHGSRHVRTKKVGVNVPKSKTALMERVAAQQVAPSQDDEKFVDCRGGSSDHIPSAKDRTRLRRFKLEEEVMVLQKQLQKEFELHVALENAINLDIGARPQHPRDIPTCARELLEDIAALETVVAVLEDQSIALQGRLREEQRIRESLEKNGSTHSCRQSCSPTPESKDIHIIRAPTSRRTKTPPKVQLQPSERDHVDPKPALIQHRFRITSDISDAAQPSSPSSEHRSGCSTSGDLEVSTPTSSSKPHRSETPERKVALSWFKSSRGSDITSSSEESLSSTFSSDSMEHEFLSVLDSLKSGHFSTVALQAEAATARPSPFSSARISFSGACDDQSGSLGLPSGRNQDFDAASSQALVSELFALPTSPSTPEHCVRPSSPAHASIIRQLSCDDDDALPSQDFPFPKLSRRIMGESRDNDTYSLSRRTKLDSLFAKEELFFTPKTSISGFGDPSDGPGDSQSSSIVEKVRSGVRSRVRVKLNLQLDSRRETQEWEGSQSRERRRLSYDAEYYVKH